MAPKKTKTVKKKPTIPLPPFDYNPPNVYELGVKPYLFIKCKICCTALPHLNFEWPVVPTELTLAAIKEAIIKRHGGSLPQLNLYKGVVHPDNSLADANDAATLKELGIEGAYMASPDTPLPVVTFYYDFTAACFDDVIATVEPNILTSKHDIPLKLYRKLTTPQPPSTVRQPSAAAGGVPTGTSGSMTAGGRPYC